MHKLCGLLYRLGDIPIGSQALKRQLKVKNISSIPISIFWHLFLTSDETDNKHHFNLVHHIKDVNAMEFYQHQEVNEELKLLITDYYGKEANVDTFQVEFLTHHSHWN